MNIFIFDCEWDNKRGEALEKYIESLSDDLVTDYNGYSDVYNDRPTCGCNERYSDSHCPQCSNDQDFIAIDNPAIIFIHTSNQCFYGFAKKIISTDKHWLICYSGGGPSLATAYNALKKVNPDSTKIEFFGLSKNATVKDIKRMWNIGAFIKAVIEDQPNPFDYLVRKPKSHLSVLGIRSFGYLMAHGGYGLSDREWWKKYYETRIADDHKLKGSDFQLTNMTKTEKPAWWKDIVDSDQILLEITEVQSDDLGNSNSALLALVNYVKTNKAVSNYTESEFTDLVKNAYKAYCDFEDSKGRGYL